jgi:sugar phosphate isomerase/epimerase
MAAGVLGGTESKATAAEQKTARPANEPFGYCLNLSTIRGQKLTLAEEVEVAAKAGYHAIEPWMNKLEEHVKSGGSLRDLGKRIADLGLTVESAIGFAEWIVDDDARRARGLEQAKRDMDALRQIGGKRIAAPPAGATDQADLNLFGAAERYGALVELGEKMEVIPQVEVWGFSKCLSRLGETTFVAIESGRSKACILPDVYHIYKGGSDFAGLGLLSGSAVHVFHVNDYPAEPKRDTIRDADRVYPGDGIAPLSTIFRDIYNAGFRGYLSLELFNPEYWKQDALQVARTGLQKSREAVQRALA